jgi:hypothetical protein
MTAQAIPKDLKRQLFGMGARWHAWMSIIMNFLGFGCLIVGIVGDASRSTPGLTPTLWVLIAIAAWLWALAAWICAYAAAKEG